MTAIRVQSLWKSYRSVHAVRNIDVTVEDGEFFAFLGVNGAGKSTTINCLTTLLRPDSGTVEVAGHTLGRADQAIRDSIGVVFQRPLLDVALSVRENLQLRGEFHGLAGREFRARTAELTDLLDLGDFVDRRYGKLSGGQQRRADIARAMLHDPTILFLDEPTAGLDPHSREQVWAAITDVRESQGMTVFLTTHYMEETERADRVAIIHAGEIVARGTPAGLRERFSNSLLSLRLNDLPGLEERLGQLDQPLPEGFEPGGALTLAVATPAEAKQTLAALWQWVDDFEFRHGSMDDVFLFVTQAADDARAGRATDPGAATARRTPHVPLPHAEAPAPQAPHAPHAPRPSPTPATDRSDPGRTDRPVPPQSRGRPGPPATGDDPPSQADWRDARRREP